MFDLSLPGALKHLAERIAEKHEEVTGGPARYSWRLKPSDIGDECTRRVFFAYRWMKRSPIPGHAKRKMERGNEAEGRLIRYVRAMGFEVSEFDPSKPETDKFRQWNMKALDGHMSAYLDSAIRHPEFTNGQWWNGEYKTMMKKYYNEAVSKGIRLSNNKYYVQACMYMQYWNFPYTLFIIECTDDQSTHFEIIERDDETANRYMHLAHSVKEMRSRPAGIGMSPTYFKCKGCSYLDICHLGKAPDKNCRSCVNLVATEGGKFGCLVHRHIPNEEQILAACPQYEGM